MTISDSDRIVLERIEAILHSPDYQRKVFPAKPLCDTWDLTPQTLSNWVRRSRRTGVHRYPGGYDPNEIMRWILIRGERGRRSDARPLPEVVDEELTFV